MIKEDDEHQFVAQDICMYCGEIKQIIMQTQFTKDGRPKGKLPSKVCTSPEPCDKCKEQGKKEGWFYLVEADDNGPTGRYVKAKREAFKGKQEDIDKWGFALMPKTDFEEMFDGNNRR